MKWKFIYLDNTKGINNTSRYYKGEQSMKTFDDLKQMMEDYNAWGSTNRSALSDVGTYRVDIDEQMFRINVFLENYFQRPILDSAGAFNALRAKLNIVGLDFTFDRNQVCQEGSFSFPMNRHGGSFGTKPDHDLSKGFYTDDGIPGMSIALEGEVKMESNGYVVTAKVAKTADRTDEYKPQKEEPGE